MADTATDSALGAAIAAPLVDLDQLVQVVPIKLYGTVVHVRPLNGNEYRKLVALTGSADPRERMGMIDLADAVIIDAPTEARGTLTIEQAGYVLRVASVSIDKVAQIAEELAAKKGGRPAGSSPTPPASSP